MNETNLFNALRGITSDKRLSQVQVDSVNAILEACVKYHVTEQRQIAYILATAFHESRLKPIEEIGHGAGHPYGKFINGHVYYGRGFVQLTWKDNYATFSKRLNIDLVNRPELALNIEYAADILVLGMRDAMFTGVGLSKYLSETKNDPLNARRIVNGIDCAALIRGYYQHILSSL
jgi:predicted chitinase